MNHSVIARLNTLDYANKSRKASYPVAGSKIKFVKQESPTYTLIIPEGEFHENLRIKFIAKNTHNGKALVDLKPIASIKSDFSVAYPRLAFLNEPQTGDGTVIMFANINSPYAEIKLYVKIVAMGTTTGTFVRL